VGEASGSRAPEEPEAPEVLGVHEFRAAVSELLQGFRADPAADPVVVGTYRRPEAVLVPWERWQALRSSARRHAEHPDLPAIRAQLARTPEERLDGLRAAAAFFADARPVP
jgi:hypothetical protein